MAVTVTTTFKSGGDKSPSLHTKLRLCLAITLDVKKLILKRMKSEKWAMGLSQQSGSESLNAFPGGKWHDLGHSRSFKRIAGFAFTVLWLSEQST